MFSDWLADLKQVLTALTTFGLLLDAVVISCIELILINLFLHCINKNNKQNNIVVVTDDVLVSGSQSTINVLPTPSVHSVLQCTVLISFNL